MNSNNAGRGKREGFSMEGGSSLLTQTSKVLRSGLLKLLQWKWFNYSLKVGQNLGFIGVQRIYAVNKCNKVRTTPNNFAINYRWHWLERPVPESEPGIPVPNWVPEPGNEIGKNREIWYLKMYKISGFSTKFWTFLVFNFLWKFKIYNLLELCHRFSTL